MRLAVVIATTTALLYSDSRCMPCHSKQVESYARTGMGRSVGAPVPEPALDADIPHRLSGRRFRVLVQDSRLLHEAAEGTRRAAYSPVWAIGSGTRGKSYVIAVDDALFQSPISWYSARAAFDLSPGYETDKKPDFFRPITPECLFCHTGSVRPVRGTQNRYLDASSQPAPIGCDRCHGEAAAHLAAPGKGTIVNPARLAPDRRDAVCEQCHLSGEARIPNPKRDFSDFRPGMRLEDVFSVYVRETRGDPRGLKVVSHSEQLAASRCFLRSGSKLWCGTCHDPHATPADKVGWYREKCLACHSDQTTRAHRRSAGEDCAGCHMPRTRAYDGGHTAFHDHSIGVRRGKPETPGSERLRAWREPPEEIRVRNLGLAYISVGAKSGNPTSLSEGRRLLERLKPGDGALETARGLMLLQMNRTAEAVEAFRRAADEESGDSSRRYNLAVALFAAGEWTAAKRNAEEAIRLEPLFEDAYALLAAMEPDRAAEWRQRYRKLVPQRWLP